MAAAVASIRAEPAPDVIYAAGTLVMRAMAAPAASCSSISGMYAPSACAIASRTSGMGVEPPSMVTLPVALITGTAPSSL